MDPDDAGLRQALVAAGIEVVVAKDAPHAIEVMRQKRPGLVVTDQTLPYGDGVGVLSVARAMDDALPVVVVVEPGDVQGAVAAMQRGALECVAKPLDVEALVSVCERAIDAYRLASDAVALTVEADSGASGIVGRDPQLARVLRSLARAAATDATVLLQGREWNGERALRARAPPVQRAGRASVCRNQLCRHTRESAGVRAVWSRKGGIHRRGGPQARQVRSGQWRDPVSGRNWRPARLAPSKDPSSG